MDDLSKNWPFKVRYRTIITNNVREVTIAAWSYDEALTEAQHVLPEGTKIIGIARLEPRPNGLR